MSDLKKNISDKENRTNDIETRINEILDNLSEDEKLEIESILTEENDAFVPKEVAKKAKELLKQTTSEGTVEKKVIEVNSLYEEQKKLNKEIKEGKTNIEIEAAKETENLIKIVEIRNKARKLGITRILATDRLIKFEPMNLKIALTNSSNNDILIRVQLEISKLENTIKEKG